MKMSKSIFCGGARVVVVVARVLAVVVGVVVVVLVVVVVVVVAFVVVGSGRLMRMPVVMRRVLSTSGRRLVARGGSVGRVR